MATYSSAPPDMAIATWGGGAFRYVHDSSQDSSTSRFYELYDTNGPVGTGQYGIEIRWENNQNVIYAETAGNTDTPRFFTANSDTSVVLNSSAPTTVLIYGSGPALEGDFVVAVDNLWSSQSSGNGLSLIHI